jgi:chromosome segregation ATPase
MMPSMQRTTGTPCAVASTQAAVCMQEQAHALRVQRQELEEAAKQTAEALELSRGDVKQLQQQLAQAHVDMRAHQQRKVDEMDRVENRVKAAIQRKDETISALRAQVADLQHEMRTAEDMLTVDQ